MYMYNLPPFLTHLVQEPANTIETYIEHTQYTPHIIHTEVFNKYRESVEELVVRSNSEQLFYHILYIHTHIHTIEETLKDKQDNKITKPNSKSKYPGDLEGFGPPAAIFEKVTCNVGLVICEVQLFLQ